jgi:hypothetical protein
MNCVFAVPKSRSTTDPNRAFAGGRVFLVHCVLSVRLRKSGLEASGVAERTPNLTKVDHDVVSSCHT